MSQKISRKSFLQASLLIGAKIGIGATGLAALGCDAAAPAPGNDAASGSDGGGARDSGSAADAFSTTDSGTPAPDASEAPDASAADLCTGAIVASISNNHGHELTVPLADVMAGTERIYDA